MSTHVFMLHIILPMCPLAFMWTHFLSFVHVVRLAVISLYVPIILGISSHDRQHTRELFSCPVAFAFCFSFARCRVRSQFPNGDTETEGWSSDGPFTVAAVNPFNKWQIERRQYRNSIASNMTRSKRRIQIYKKCWRRKNYKLTQTRLVYTHLQSLARTRKRTSTLLAYVGQPSVFRVVNHVLNRPWSILRDVVYLIGTGERDELSTGFTPASTCTTQTRSHRSSVCAKLHRLTQWSVQRRAQTAQYRQASLATSTRAEIREPSKLLDCETRVCWRLSTHVASCVQYARRSWLCVPVCSLAFLRRGRIAASANSCLRGTLVSCLGANMLTLSKQTPCHFVYLRV